MRLGVFWLVLEAEPGATFGDVLVRIGDVSALQQYVAGGMDLHGAAIFTDEAEARDEARARLNLSGNGGAS